MSDPLVDTQDLRAHLSEIGFDPALATQTVRELPSRALGILLFGSRARRDHDPSSDVDLLALVTVPRAPISAGPIHVSFYTTEQLTTASETLFGMHLARDGAILHDPTGALGALLRTVRPPTASQLYGRVQDLSTVLYVQKDEETRYLPGLVRTGRYLLRTAVYAKALESGRPCFSVRELSERFRDPVLIELLASDPAKQSPPNVHALDEIKSRLLNIVGPPPPNPFGTLRSLVVHELAVPTDRATLAALILGDTGHRVPYGEFPKVLL